MSSLQSTSLEAEILSTINSSKIKTKNIPRDSLGGAGVLSKTAKSIVFLNYFELYLLVYWCT